mmetsp:Transcript_36924/g.42537  ORF Transcript_36924/g.42537 Transcript_36924/m.42537 type:complete len:123 (-) Transcript_36924:24-392(-)
MLLFINIRPKKKMFTVEMMFLCRCLCLWINKSLMVLRVRSSFFLVTTSARPKKLDWVQQNVFLVHGDEMSISVKTFACNVLCVSFTTRRIKASIQWYHPDINLHVYATTLQYHTTMERRSYT